MKRATMGLATVLGGFLGLHQAAQAQGSYVDDALLYSRQNPTGTARTLGLGGASTSLGGDYGSMATNPAGLGLYTKSEFTVSPGLGIGSANTSMVANAASLAQQGLQQSANSFHIASIGLVFANRRADGDQRSDWRGGSFALGFTRLADFNYGFRYRNLTDDAHSFYQFLREPGGYPQNSVNSAGYQDAVAFIRNQESSGNYEDRDGLAYGNYLTNTDLIPGTNYRAVTISNPRVGEVQQDGIVQSKGSLSQFDIGYGGNYRDRFYIGGGVGIVSMNRTLTSTFGELQNSVTNFYYDDYVKTTGTGINARLGVIVRPTDAIRLGASVQTPTYLRLTEDYYTTLTVNPDYVQPLPGQSAQSPVLSTPSQAYDYSVTLPFRANGGLTVLLNKYGFLTGDVEYVGYSQTRFNTVGDDNSGSFGGDNETIRSGYKNAVNVKVGVEGRFDIFRARLGYARYGNPYNQGDLDRAQNYFTGGLGFRTKSFFLDAAEVYVSNKDQYTPYTLNSAASPIASINASRATTTVTAGFLF